MPMKGSCLLREGKLIFQKDGKLNAEDIQKLIQVIRANLDR